MFLFRIFAFINEIELQLGVCVTIFGQVLVLMIYSIRIRKFLFSKLWNNLIVLESFTLCMLVKFPCDCQCLVRLEKALTSFFFSL